MDKLRKRFGEFDLKAINVVAQHNFEKLYVYPNETDTCTESYVQGYCNFASLKMVFKIYKDAIQEFVLKSKNGSTASKKENMEPGSVDSYIASLNKTMEAHFIGKMDVNSLMQKYSIEQLKQLVHEQISKRKTRTPNTRNSNCKGPLQKFFLFIKDEYYKKPCEVEGCDCHSLQHVQKDITICEMCGCGCCDTFKQHACHNTDNQCRGKLHCKGCDEYYPYCLFSIFFTNPKNVLDTSYISYQCDVCASRKTASRKLADVNKRHIAPKAGPRPEQTIFEQMNKCDCVTVERKNLEPRRFKIPDRYYQASSRIEEGQIEVKVIQKKEIGFFEGYLRFHALVKCTDHRFRYKPGDIVVVCTNEGLRRRDLVNKFFQILKGEYNAI